MSSLMILLSIFVILQVVREFEDFDNLRKKLAAKFPGTNFPPLPKTLFSLVEGSVKEQVASLEKFLKFIAATKKLAASSEIIEFLGKLLFVAYN